MNSELHVFLLPKSLLKKLEERMAQTGEGEDKILSRALVKYLKKKQENFTTQTTLKAVA